MCKIMVIIATFGSMCVILAQAQLADDSQYRPSLLCAFRSGDFDPAAQIMIGCCIQNLKIQTPCDSFILSCLRSGCRDIPSTKSAQSTSGELLLQNLLKPMDVVRNNRTIQQFNSLAAGCGCSYRLSGEGLEKFTLVALRILYRMFDGWV